MKPFLIVCLCLVSGLSFSQDTLPLTRTPYKLSVAVSRKYTYREDINATPYVQPDKTIRLYPGETIFVEVEEKDGVITGMRAVKEVADPKKTITISFSQHVERKVHQLVMLKVENPFTQSLLYTAKICLLQGHTWIDTDVYPVLPGLAGIETWQDVIVSIVLSDWAFQTS